MLNVELGCARALPVDGRSAVRAMGAMGMMGAPGAMWERCGLWHGRARYENLDTLRALSADIFE